MENSITIRGARENNLKNISVSVPRDRLIVFTGLSGSGKSSLAFDTLYAEGQRRYVESLSAYARQFLGQMDKPDVDAIDGLSPAISIDQKTTSHNPRSTVGTVTEIHDYLRLLFARIGIPHCPVCGREIQRQSVDQMIAHVLRLDEGMRIQVLAPVVRGRKGTFSKLLQDLRKSGFVRVRADGEMYDLSEEIDLKKTYKHHIEVVVDRLIVRSDIRKRLSDSIETALGIAEGLVIIDVIGGDSMLFSQNYACPDCNVSIEELTPRMFSFNSPFGACPDCAGLGTHMKVDEELIVPNKNRSLAQGAIQVTGWNTSVDVSMAGMYLKALSEHLNFDLNTPVKDLPPEIMHAILYGTQEKIRVEYQREYGSGVFHSKFEGIIVNLERRYKETQSDAMKAEIEAYMANTPCELCHGTRYRKEVMAVHVGGQNIAEISELSVVDALDFFAKLELSDMHGAIAHQILQEIEARLTFLSDVGLEYLNLSRSAATLSGGEAQRIRLATQIGSKLVGVLYILDEPSIGLHQRDNARLLRTLEKMRDLGNTLVVVEHDEDTIRAADHIVDIGPRAGIHGGEVVAQGGLRDIMNCPESLTGQYLSGRMTIPVPEKRRTPSGYLTIEGATQNNLKKLDVKIPLGVMTCVTGVSGSGKSSLINEVLYKVLARDLNRAKVKPGAYKAIRGLEALDKVIDIDQSPIGRTPRSNPATYTGLFDLIRDVYAQTPDAKMRGYKNGRFSFNVKGGRCEACRGDGIIRIEMHFLPDVYVPCEVCKGKRYNQETLEVHYKGKSISDVLDMTVEGALSFFSALPRLKRKLETLYDVGLGYIKLGQSSTTLSGGEAQRVKLATELSKRSTGRTLYILDEPTTGLHTDDVKRLLEILTRLAAGGNSVVVIEHNLDVIKTADHIIDLGPEGGDKGGEIVCEGTPEQVAKNKSSYTGQFLMHALQGIFSAG